MRAGNVIVNQNGYQIREVIQEHMDGSTEVIGYNLFGPRADSSWLHSAESAMAKFAELTGIQQS